MTQRGKPVNAMLVNLLRVLILVALVAGWQFAPTSVLDPLIWSRPSAIAVQVVHWSMDGTLLWSTLYTLESVVLGLALGAIAGIAVGVWLGMSRRADRMFSGLIDMIFALPKITLVPLFMLWLGIGTEQHVIFVALVVFFFFFFSIYSGIHGIPQAQHDNFRLFGASERQKVRLLILPACLGWLALSLRLALPYAFVAAISTEVIASTNGLGNLVKNSAAVMNAAGMFAAMLTLLAVSLIASLLVNRCTRSFQQNIQGE